MKDPVSPSCPIAIVGLGAVTPGGHTLEALWSIFEGGLDATGQVPPSRWGLDPDAVLDPTGPRPDRVYTDRGGFIEDGFRPDPSGLPSELRDRFDADRGLQWLWHAAREACDDGGALAPFVPERRGLWLANIVLPNAGAIAVAQHVFLRNVLGPRTAAPRPDGIEVAGAPAGWLARALGIGGPHLALDAACASSLFAVDMAVEALGSGRIDVAVVGGLCAPDPLYTQMGFSALGALSRTGRCRPFDRAADGLLVSEGATAITLVRLDDALARSLKIWGVVRGIGLCNDVDGKLLAPSQEGQLRAMRAAHAQAGWDALDVDRVSCHATGTPVGDRVELGSLAALADEHPEGPHVALGATKANLGHLLTGAGLAALVETALAMDRQVLPPIANFEAPSTTLHPRLRIGTRSETWPSGSRPPRAAISAFGFGGTNAHLLLEAHEPRSTSVRVPVSPRVPGSEDPVVLVGMAARVGPWKDLEALGRRFEGEAAPAVRPKAGWEERALPSGWFLDELELPLDAFRTPPRELGAILPQQSLMLALADDLARSSLGEQNLEGLDRMRTGVFVGVTLDLATTDHHLRWTAQNRAQASARQVPESERQVWLDAVADAAGPALDADRTIGGLASIVASRIGRFMRLGGPALTVSTEDTSGLTALVAAVRALQSGRLDAAVVGAVEIADPRLLRARGAVGSPPAAAGRPFDENPVRCPPSEGGALLLAMRRSDAIAQGRTTYAELQGVAEASAAPDRASRMRAYERVLDEAWEELLGRGPQAFEAHAAGDLELDAIEAEVLGRRFAEALRLTSVRAEVGDCGPVVGLLGVVKAAWMLHRRRLPAGPGTQSPRPELARASTCRRTRPWLCDRDEQPSIGVSSLGTTGAVTHVALRSSGASSLHVSTPPDRARLFVLDGANEADLRRSLRALLEAGPDRSWAELEARVLRGRKPDAGRTLAVVARSRDDLRSELQDLQGQPQPGAGRAYWTPDFIRRRNPELAFVFPGSGNHHPGMGRTLLEAFPEIVEARAERDEHLRAHINPELVWDGDAATLDADPRGLIFAQVALGGFATDVLAEFGVRPRAAVGYSLGETTALFATGAWRDRDTMHARAMSSRLFTELLAGPCEAARATFDWPPERPFSWALGVVEASPEAVRAVLPRHPHARLLIVNTPDACVVGGEAGAVSDLVGELHRPFHPLRGVTTVHCDVVRMVEDEYRALHTLPTGAPEDVRIYSGAWGRAYDVDPATAAAAVTAQAIEGIDFPRVVRQAHQDGSRLFLELGPGSSCTRMIRQILDDQPHAAHAMLTPGRDGWDAVLHALAWFAAHRIDVDFTRLIARSSSPNVVSVDRTRRDAPTLRIEVGRGPIGVPEPPGARRSAEATVSSGPVVDRSGCLLLAQGSLASLFGPAFEAVDALPDRVRLPSEPLMLVDRIVELDAEPLSMKPGRVVTEHDVRSGAWYLDAGRMCTSVAIESGQADLFLSGYLGIDLQTQGRAQYRLLDASVTFHGELPGPNSVVRYDIRIERFFRQGDTWLFRFAFDATVDGRSLLSMRDGCAGFFTPEQLAAGRGLVGSRATPPASDIGVDEGARPHPDAPRRLGPTQIEALVRGDLELAFGPAFRNRVRSRPVTIPDGDLRLIHRVVENRNDGGRYDQGFIRSEADIDPQAWFLTCHFAGDPVMPGTLMYEACLQTLRVHLLSSGWIAAGPEARFEPAPGVTSSLQCRGQVLPTTRTVAYEISIRRLTLDPEPMAVADAVMLADDRPIVEVRNMSLRLSGATGASLQALWRGAREVSSGGSSLLDEPMVGPDSKPARFDRDHLDTFASGKPSRAFGEPYAPFDPDPEGRPGRFIARLPRAPLSCIDRITEVRATAFELRKDAEVEAQFDVRADGWYSTQTRGSDLPFAILQESALQTCGWLAAFCGSALASDADLRFRNLGGEATVMAPLPPGDEVLTTRARLTDVSRSGDMLIQHFRFVTLARSRGPVYAGTTYFGFFTPRALAAQRGLDKVVLDVAAPRLATPRRIEDGPPMAGGRLRMIDRIEALVLDPGFIAGSIDVDPDAWFFEAHFLDDPVWPGSLGLQSLLQLLEQWTMARWQLGPQTRFRTMATDQRHRWTYRGQITPDKGRVHVEARIKRADEATRRVVADGLLAVDGLPIYAMNDFGVEVKP